MYIIDKGCLKFQCLNTITVNTITVNSNYVQAKKDKLNVFQNVHLSSEHFRNQVTGDACTYTVPV